jgi:hypothetical protein
MRLAFSNEVKTPAPDIGHGTVLQEKRRLA